MKQRALKIKLADPRRQLDDIVCSKESPVRLIHRSIVHCIQSSIRRKRFCKYQIDLLLICLIVFKQKELEERQTSDEDVERIRASCVHSAKIPIAGHNL
jgi:hypothetical protein